jgi:hypothetical protein
VERAIELVGYFAHHARAAFTLVGADGPMGLARETAGWILGRGVWKFSRRECHRAFDHRIETVASWRRSWSCSSRTATSARLSLMPPGRVDGPSSTT